jgi:aspartate aminotransferase
MTVISTASQSLNSNLVAAKPSATYKMMSLAAERRAAGAPVISLTAGEPDFDTPVHICEAAIQAIRDGYTRYTPVAGMQSLREAVAAKFTNENGIDTHWRETIVANGAKHILYNALTATLNSGDEVIVPAPYWVSYPEMVQLCGARSVIVKNGEESNFKLTAPTLSKAISSHTRWLILNSPSNPSGAVYTKNELLAIADVLRLYPRILVLADDIYEHLVFDDQKFYTLAQVAPDLRDRILTVNGVSKAYAMTGWRIGYATGPSWLLQAMETLQGQQTSGASSISQCAALAALTGSQTFIQDFRHSFQTRRDLVVKLLNQIPGLCCKAPSGAFYVFASCAGLIGKVSPAGTALLTDEDVATALLNEAGVAVVHGSAFGMDSYLRIAYALDEKSLRAACIAIARFYTNVRT